jgi:hypothetical protein
MKLRQLTASFAVLTALGMGVAMAQTNPSAPSAAPNDSTATPPNSAPSMGRMPPAPTDTTTPGMGMTKPTHPRDDGGVGKAPSDKGNTNPSPTQGGAAPYQTQPKN